MTDRTTVHGLQVANELHQFVNAEVLPGTGVAPEAFWQGFDALVNDLAPRNAALLARLMPEVLAEHRQMEQLWQRLQPQLAAIAQGQSSTLDSADAGAFGELYLRHMDKEESHIAPMAKRLFSPGQMQRLGNAMRVRRGIALPEGA